MDGRSKQFVFVRYNLNDYRLWDPVKRKIIVQRDIDFDEKRKSTEEKKIQLEDLEEDDRTDEEETLEEEEEENLVTEESLEYNETFEDAFIPEQESEFKTEEIEKVYLPKRFSREKKKPHCFDKYVLLTYQEAIKGSDKIKWLEAIREEKESLQNNSTWELVDKEKVRNKILLSNK